MRISFKIVVFLIICFPKTGFADVTLNNLFSNGMVVQRDAKIPIWGWADVNENVIVSTSWGASASVVTAADGTWRIDIKTPQAGGPHNITVSGKNIIEITDVLSGDIWLCAGQSNMDFSISKLVNNSKDPEHQPLVEYIRNEVATANDNWIRHIAVPSQSALFNKKLNFEDHWRSVNPEQIKEISATGYFFAKAIRKEVNVPIGLLECALGGTRIQPWISEETYMADPNMKAYFEASLKKSKEITEKISAENYVDTTYTAKFEAWKTGGKKTPKPYPSIHPSLDKQLPATLYNGMLSAVLPFKIKGVLWYQGESNSHFLEEEYQTYFTALIKSWRADWKQTDLPFYWMQLANYKVPDERSNLGWASVNNQLRASLKLPNTGMAVLYDIGEAKDVHPHNKMDAGSRLALWALKNDYHVKVSAVSGPLYKSHKIKGNKIQVKFSEAGNGLMVGHKHLLDPAIEVSNQPLKTFEIKEKDGVWKPAKAKIISKNKLEVWSAEVLSPMDVRYAWSSNPEGANLYNKQGLPASVFLTKN
ncbi:sialate O-acetylesterase [Algibacter miyuki]|uniref:Sialate O-acetylesterase n=1 Tax=Algibacter miyuki TaxID=1306933 RepID=A0ABV5H3X5_9FLAO|nr:sialate O-acetylesterase [Algibacter miyuki]MDN3665552.1 sialate O-acetylesterase [Algibacter miyuki]